MKKRYALPECYDTKLQEEIMEQTNQLLNLRWNWGSGIDTMLSDKSSLSNNFSIPLNQDLS